MKYPLVVLAILTLSACGFTPMYGSHTGSQSGAQAAAGLNQVDIDIIPNAEGVVLRNHLIDRFYSSGYPESPRYRLVVAPLQQTLTNFDLTRDAEVTSRQIEMATTFTLTDLPTGSAVLERSIRAYGSYNVIGSQFTTRVSEADARDAALSDLARQIETQIALYFNR